MQYPSITLLTALFAISLGHAEMRIWTSIQGTKIKAEMISADGQSVNLKFESGAVRNVKLQSLSEDDQNYVAQQTAGRGSGQAQGGSLPGFDQPWPKASKDPGNYEVQVIQEGPDEFIYETPHYRFVSDGKLGKSLMKTISTIFEATYEANKALPLGNMPWVVKDHKFLARFFQKKEDYMKAGGLPDSAGVFIGGGEQGTGTVMVPFESLGVKEFGSSYTIDRDKTFSTLIHEITHQMMPGKSTQEAWFIEGSAEYVAHSPYRNGRFNFNNNKGSIIENVIAYGKNNTGGRGLGKDIKAPSLHQFMTQSYEQFIGRNANLNYGLAPLITYYFYHVDGKGDAARIKAYVKALLEDKKPDEARALLMDGRSYDELARAITTFWRRSGITIEFEPSGKQ